MTSLWTSSPSTWVLYSLVPIALWTLYRYLLPRPIPTIPYNVEAVSSILGDIPSILREPAGTLAWGISQARKHSSPLCQVFLRPFGKPFVILTDYREMQDIMMRRKEWDRSDFSIELLQGQAPNHHINLKTGPAWKAHRRLLQDLMTPKFLHDVAAPNIHKSVGELVQLWERKERSAAGRPFAADQDIYYAALDAVLEFSFGDSFSHRALPPQIQHTQWNTGTQIPEGPDDPVEFQYAPLDESLEATLRISKTIKEIGESPFPRISWFYVNRRPSEMRAINIRDKYLKEQALKAIERLHEDSDKTGDTGVKSAVDLMMRRERHYAEKDGREPIYWSPAMKDEIIGFIVAGHDTTSTTLTWGIKFLADSPLVQNQLREALQIAHATAFVERRSLTIQEITGTSIPYLDAVMEEILRCAGTISILERQCTQDTTVLGHPVPKGTTVLMFNRGPSYTEQGFEIDESIRSPSCQTAAKEFGIRTWESKNMDKFSPERWLRKEGDEHVFDATAGPTLPFGLGMRGCFGRRLAYLELRIMVTMLIWNFRFLQCPEKLNDYGVVEELTYKPKQCYVRLERIWGEGAS